MQLTVTAASGNVLHYSTGDASPRRIGDGVELAVVRTTIVTRDASGTILRRLREDYSPALLTAVWGVFEEPDDAGGWTAVREFSLAAIVTTKPAGPSVAAVVGASTLRRQAMARQELYYPGRGVGALKEFLTLSLDGANHGRSAPARKR